MLLNVTKTNYIHFSSKWFNFERSINYHNEHCNQVDQRNWPVIEKVRYLKYLGIILDDKLPWRDHMLKLQASIKAQTRKLYFLRIICDQNILRCLYRGLVQYRLLYGVHSTVYSNILRNSQTYLNIKNV